MSSSGTASFFPMGAGKGKSSKDGHTAPYIGAGYTEEKDMPTTIPQLQQLVREQRNAYMMGYAKGRVDEQQKWTAVIENAKIDFNDAVVKGKMLEYDRLNNMARVRLEEQRREIEDKLALTYIL